MFPMYACSVSYLDHGCSSKKKWGNACISSLQKILLSFLQQSKTEDQKAQQDDQELTILIKTQNRIKIRKTERAKKYQWKDQNK